MQPRFDRFTIKAQEAFQDAQNIATDRNQQQLDVEHLLLALINQKKSLTTQLFLKLGANAARISARLEGEIDKSRTVFIKIFNSSCGDATSIQTTALSLCCLSRVINLAVNWNEYDIGICFSSRTNSHLLSCFYFLRRHVLS